MFKRNTPRQDCGRPQGRSVEEFATEAVMTRNLWVVAALGLMSAAALLTTGCASSDSTDQPSALKGDSADQNTQHAHGQYVPRTPGNGGQ